MPAWCLGPSGACARPPHEAPGALSCRKILGPAWDQHLGLHHLSIGFSAAGRTWSGADGVSGRKPFWRRGHGDTAISAVTFGSTGSPLRGAAPDAERGRSNVQPEGSMDGRPRWRLGGSRGGPPGCGRVWACGGCVGSARGAAPSPRMSSEPCGSASFPHPPTGGPPVAQGRGLQLRAAGLGTACRPTRSPRGPGTWCGSYRARCPIRRLEA